ncbi:hypothetical protein JANAI62_12390 [Jannaschia pagri]|uniref:Uncharacterized protein n=1 Tax=Jannaschia pagri TaxID=2829797 RepID=A0ABQ4NJN6_9RHOB|nr:hypothetical protein JANAI61_12420 [Jannaschia sp. AI_61]GIT94616.1 hypothetical protein JANAI62_12390 [Jannaschia sp. AI_62]
MDKRFYALRPSEEEAMQLAECIPDRYREEVRGLLARNDAGRQNPVGLRGLVWGPNSERLLWLGPSPFL